MQKIIGLEYIGTEIIKTRYVKEEDMSCTCANNPNVLCTYCINQASIRKARKHENPDERMERERREMMKDLGHGRLFER